MCSILFRTGMKHRKTTGAEPRSYFKVFSVHSQRFSLVASFSVLTPSSFTWPPSATFVHSHLLIFSVPSFCLSALIATFLGFCTNQSVGMWRISLVFVYMYFVEISFPAFPVPFSGLTLFSILCFYLSSNYSSSLLSSTLNP